MNIVRWLAIGLCVLVVGVMVFLAWMSEDAELDFI